MRLGVVKCELEFGEALLRGVLANALVCLAIWLCQAGRSVTDRILAILLPITALVVLGLEHSVANMNALTIAWLIRDDVPLTPDLAARTDVLDAAGMLGNLASVTLGNVIGGTLLVAAIYALVYLRPGTDADGPARA